MNPSPTINIGKEGKILINEIKAIILSKNPMITKCTDGFICISALKKYKEMIKNGE